MISSIKIGIIGAGRIGKIHAKNLHQNFSNVSIKMISDINIDHAQKFAKTIGSPKVVSDYKEIINSPEIDAVIICGPTDTHAQMIEEAALNNKHIFCEKPIDLSLERIEHALDTVDKTNVKFQVGFNRRYDPHFKKTKDMIREGTIGSPQMVQITAKDPSPPPIEYVKVSGGIFMDMTIHDFDMAYFLMDKEIIEVYATGETLIDPEIKKYDDVDTAVVVLKYENGAIGVINNSRKAVYGYDQRIEVFGSEGCLTTPNTSPLNPTLWNAEGQYQLPPHHFFLDRYTDAYKIEMEEFINCIVNDQRPTCSGLDGYRAALLGHYAKKSLLENKPFKIPLEKLNRG